MATQLPVVVKITAMKEASVQSSLASTAKSLDATATAAKEGTKAAGKLGQGMAEAGKAATKSGKSMETALGKTERAVKPAVATVEKLRERLAKLGAEGAEALAKLKKGAEQAHPALDALGSSLATDRLQEAAGGLRDVGSVAGGLFTNFAEAGEGVRELERSLKRAFADPAKQREFIKIARELKKSYEGLFSADQITEALGALNKFGVATEANAKRVAALAAANPDLSIGQVAGTYGEFKKAALGGKQDFGSTEELRGQLGIDPKELVPFGAQLDSNNKLLGENAAQATAAQVALDRYIDAQARYQGVAQRASDAQSKLNTSFNTFKSSVGESINTFKNFVAEGLQPWVDGLNNTSPGFKAFVGGAAGATAGAATFGAKALELAAYAKLAGVNLGAARLAATGFLTGMGGIVVAGVAAGAALLLIGKSALDAAEGLKQAEDAEKSLRATQSKALEGRRVNLVNLDVDTITKAAEEHEDYGKRRAAVTDAIIAKDIAADKAREKGDTEAEARHRRDLNRLKAYREGLDDTIAVEVAGNKLIAESSEEAYNRALEAFNAFKKAQGRGKFDTANQAATALATTIPGLQGDARDEAESELKKLRKAGLKEDLADLQNQLELKKAKRKVGLAEELKDLAEQQKLAIKLGRDGIEEEVRIAKEGAAAKAADLAGFTKKNEEANKKLKADALKDLKEASKIDPNARTYDRGTGRAVDAFDGAIEKTKAWQKENAALIKQMPELGQAGKDAIEKLKLGEAGADVARMSKNFGDLQQELKLLDDAAVTTQEKLAAITDGRALINSKLASKKITNEQADDLIAPREEQGKDLERDRAQEQIQQRQALMSLNQAAAQQELDLAELVADGTLRSNDKLLVAKEKLHQFAIEQIKLEAEAAIAAGEERVAVQERTNTQLANLERQRTLDILKQKKAEVDAERQKLADIIALNKPAEAKKTQLDFSGTPTDQASFFSVSGLSGEEYAKRKESRRAEADLKKLDARAAFQAANPLLVAKMAEQDYQKSLQVADPTGLKRSAEKKGQASGQTGDEAEGGSKASGFVAPKTPTAGGAGTVVNVTVNVDGKNADPDERAIGEAAQRIADKRARQNRLQGGGSAGSSAPIGYGGSQQ